MTVMVHGLSSLCKKIAWAAVSTAYQSAQAINATRVSTVSDYEMRDEECPPPPPPSRPTSSLPGLIVGGIHSIMCCGNARELCARLYLRVCVRSFVCSSFSEGTLYLLISDPRDWICQSVKLLPFIVRVNQSAKQSILSHLDGEYHDLSFLLCCRYDEFGKLAYSRVRWH